jgi:hypothetical protein
MYIKISNNGGQRFPYTIQDLRQENPSTSFPLVLSNELLAGFGVYPVLENARPDTDRFSYAVKRALPELVNGEWVVLWDVLAKSQEEIAEQDERQAVEVRDSRNGKLAKTDWRFRSDMTPTQQWIDYCQALRDVTAQSGFPWSVTWPTQPE